MRTYKRGTGSSTKIRVRSKPKSDLRLQGFRRVVERTLESARCQRCILDKFPIWVVSDSLLKTQPLSKVLSQSVIICFESSS